MTRAFEQHIPRFPEHFDATLGSIVPAEPRSDGMPTLKTSVFFPPELIRSEEICTRFIAPDTNSDARGKILNEARNFFKDDTALEVFHGYIDELRGSILEIPEQDRTLEEKRTIERYHELIEKTSVVVRPQTLPTRPLYISERREQEPTRIFHMPSQFLNHEERAALKHRLFSPSERVTFQRARDFNIAMMEEADAIVIDLQIDPGFLGDGLQNSRLAGILHERYPDKVFVLTNHSDVFGKYRSVKDLDIRYGRVVLSGETTTNAFDRIFVVDPGIDTQSSGKMFSANGLENGIGSEARTDLDLVEYHNILQQAQIMWELLYGGSIDALPQPAIGISPRDQQKSRRLFNNLPTSEQLNIVIHPDTHAIAWNQKKWKTEKWIDLTGRLSKQCPQANIFVSQGVDHPEVTEEITKAHRSKTNVIALPRMSLPEYVGLISHFSPENTLFLGLESMPGSHLAPSFGIKSIVLSDVTGYFRYYGPWGGIVVANAHPDINNIKRRNVVRVGVDKVFEAVTQSAEQLLE